MGRNKAQSLAEYAVLIALVILAVGGINIYLKRGLQAKYRTLVDVAGSVTNTTSLDKIGVSQYEPYYLSSQRITDRQDLTTYTHQPGGAVKRDIASTVAVSGASETADLNTGADDAWN